jgi:two-component system response regulator AtoC
VTRLLQRRGHEVQSAPGAVTALRLYQEQTFDLVITDLRMPGMDGARLVEHLRKIDANVQVAVMTGQPSEPVVQDLLSANVTVLHKPFTIEELERAIRTRMLDQASV